MKRKLLFALIALLAAITSAQADGTLIDGLYYNLDATTPTAATVPYFCGFEDEEENQNWVLNPASTIVENNPNFVNKWGIGKAAAKQGYHSLYIYANGNLNIATYAEVNGYTFAYREFSLPVGEYNLTFNWRALGENNADEVVVYWLPVSAAANTYITANVTTNQPNTLLNTYKVSTGSAGANGLSGAASWQFAQATLRVIQPQNYRLVFCWRNNADNTYNPGGSIDNVQLNNKKTSSDCDRQPQNITANVQNSTLTVTWDAVAGAASYDLLYWLEGSGITDTVAGITSTTWSTVTTNMNTGRYTFYVRAVCADGSSSIFNEVSNVKIVGQTSDIADACPEVTFHETFFSTDGVKVIVPDCSDDGQFKIVPNLVGGGGGSIAGYEVEEIPFNPPFPFNEGTPFQENGQWRDDVWGPIIDLPFSFCFFDGIYRQAQVGANGIVSFNANYLPGGRCEWDLKGQPDIPSKDFIYKNCIFGVYEDIYPSTMYMHQNSGVFYGVLGEYPCRTLTVSWYDIPMFSCTSLFNTYQIVLYEGTNVIDVYIAERNLCTSWNNGIGIVGLINEDGTDGIAAPGRNTNNLWSVDKNQPEAWRFIPLTSSNYEITWYKGKGYDGQVLGKDEYLDIVRGDGIDTVTCRMQFTACNGDHFDLSDTAIIAWEQSDTPTSLSSAANAPAVQKVFRNGRIYILKGDETYTITGEEVK